jgi:hypothetical protein
MNRRPAHVYPFLFAIIPVVRLVAEYPGWAEMGDAAVVLATVLGACGLVYAIAWLATRRQGRLAALILFGLVLGFWGYVRIAAVVERSTGVSHPVLLPLWAAATVALIWPLSRRPALLERAERFLTLTGGILVGWFIVSIGVAEYRSARTLRQSTLVRRLAEPVTTQTGAKVRLKRDIYLIVLDEYANPEVTGRLFGFDNRAFVDSLRRLGFVIPAVHSNYLHTFLSLPSLLNAAHVAGLSDELGRGSIDRTVPDYLVRHNRTVRFLKSQGYRFVFFPSLAWEATRHSPEADLQFRAWEGMDPALELTRSGLRQVLVKTSLLRLFEWGEPRVVRRHVTRTFAAIARTPALREPVFTFAHVLKPHSPYVFDRNCRPASPRPGGNRSKQEGASYVEQVQCVNHLVLVLVTTLLRTSEVPPVILLQSDHGSKTLLFDKAEDGRQIALAAAKERLGAFGAYYLPDRGSRVFGDSVTVVNVMGHVLRYYLGAALPREREDMYLSGDPAPYAFRRVDFGWLGREKWARLPSRLRRGADPRPRRKRR